jgi:4-amino-4-deoxy-L-arabinose transferase-like glycosyltransferase
VQPDSSVSRFPLRQKLRKNFAPPFLLTLASLLIFSNLGASRDFVRAESYFALGARLMVETGDWLQPHAPDESVLNKPPLQYWLTGIAYKLFGAGYATARLPSAIAALCLLLVVYLLGAKLFDRQAGMLAAGSLMTSYLFYTFSRTAMSDMLLTLCVSAALSCFIMILTGKGASHEWWLAPCGYLFVALGVLAKGPIAAVLVAGPLVCELLISRDFSIWKRLRIFQGALIILGVAAPYFLLLYLRLGIGPLSAFFIGENFQRFTGGIYAYASRPPWYLPLAFLSDFAPWSLALFPALYFDWRTRSRETEASRARRLVYLWLFFPLVFFSLSNFKLDYYLLPSMPAAALIIGRYVWRAPGLSRPARVYLYAFTIIFSLVIIIASFISMRITAALLYSTSLKWLAVASSTGAFLFVIYSLSKGWPRRAAWALIFSTWCALLIYTWTLSPALARFQPVERLAASVPPSVPNVYTSYAATDWANTLTFHLPPGTKVTRLASDSSGDELREILKHEPHAVVLLKENELERLRASGISLRSLAEGETLGHGGMTTSMLRRPVAERLMVVQSETLAGGR